MFLVWALLILLSVFAAVAVAMHFLNLREVADFRVEGSQNTASIGQQPAAVSRTRRQFSKWKALALLGAVALSASAIWYWRGGSESGELALPAGPQSPGNTAGAADLATLTRQLETRLAQAPNDAEGWRLLGGSHVSLGNYARAADAYGKAVALGQNDVETLSAYGEALVQAAAGEITPAARETFRKALAVDPKDVRARYFLAAGLNQDGNSKAAIDAWLDLLDEAPADAPWALELRQLVTQRASETKIDISARLERLPSAQTATAAPPAPNPSAEQMAAVQAMPAEDQQAMIRGMVDRLEERLNANPADAEGWQRLIRARMVLGEPQKASAALAKAEAALANKPEELQAIRAFARENGVG